MGGEPEWIAEESRPLYHAALALGANHLVTLVAQSMELLTKAGVTAPDRMLGPLLGAALDNALRSGDAALTGPVARGDAGTVAAHIAELRAHAPQAVAGYVAMARATADRALAHGLLKAELAEDLLVVLADQERRPGGPGPGRPDDDVRQRDQHRPGGPQLYGIGGGPMTRTMRTTLLRTAAELDALPRPAGAERAVVMTMGALHDGHAALIRAARAAAGPDGQVVVTVFVNPLQFGEAADLDRYPRTLDADLEIAAAAGPTRSSPPARTRSTPAASPRSGSPPDPWASASKARPGPGTSTGCSPSSPSSSTSPAPTRRSTGRRTPSSSP